MVRFLHSTAAAMSAPSEIEPTCGFVYHPNSASSPSPPTVFLFSPQRSVIFVDIRLQFTNVFYTDSCFYSLPFANSFVRTRSHPFTSDNNFSLVLCCPCSLIFAFLRRGARVFLFFRMSLSYSRFVYDAV